MRINSELWKSIGTDFGILDDCGNNITDIYIKNVSSMIANPANTARNLLKIWEIRSLVHFNDRTIFDSKKGKVYKHHDHEPFFLDFGRHDWSREIHEKWAIGFKFPSNIFEGVQYEVMEILREDPGRTPFNLWLKEPPINDSPAGYITGVIIKETDSVETHTNKLHVCFRETTGAREIALWSGAMLPFNQYSTVQQKNHKIKVNKLIWEKYSSKNPNTKIDSIRTTMVDWFNRNTEFVRECHCVCLSGMSLGGAMSQCAAIDLAPMLQRINKPMKMFLFGSPKLSDESFVSFLNYYNVNCFRIDADADDTPCFPTSNGVVGIQWKHAGIKFGLNIYNSSPLYIHYDNLNNIITNGKCSRRLPWNITVNGFTNIRNPHQRHFYFKLLCLVYSQFTNQIPPQCTYAIDKYDFPWMEDQDAWMENVPII